MLGKTEPRRQRGLHGSRARRPDGALQEQLRQQVRRDVKTLNRQSLRLCAPFRILTTLFSSLLRPEGELGCGTIALHFWPTVDSRPRLPVLHFLLIVF